MLVRFLSILFLILAVALNGRAQDIHYSQFYMAPLHLNPAMAGVMNCNNRIITNYRNQWATVLTNPYNTFSASYDQKVPVGRSDYFGWGASAWGDIAGETKYKQFMGRLTGSFSKKLFGKFEYDECVRRYVKSVNLGLLKIMSKMGISVISSYRGGCNFETVGLSRTIVNDFFPGVLSKISGIGLTGIEKKVRNIHQQAYSASNNILPIGGIYRYRKTGETHQYQGRLIHMLQTAVTKG